MRISGGITQVDKFKRGGAFLFLFLLAGAAFPDNACVICHIEITPEIIASFRVDPHSDQESCSSCHGGNPDASPDDMDAAHAGPDFTPPPWSAAVSVGRCGKCHTGEMERFLNGPHRIAANQGGEGDLPGCIDCHSPHPVHRVNSKISPVRPRAVHQTCGRCHADKERMAPYDLDHNIIQQYRTSVHGRALLDNQNSKSPSCTGCHGAHGEHNPEVNEFDEACARCHTNEAESFRNSRHKRVWEITGAPLCITCHGDHAIQGPDYKLLGVGEGTICGRCHDAGEGPDAMLELLAMLENELERGQEVLVQAQRAHRNVTDELKILEKVRDQLFIARESVHFFNVEKLKREVEIGLELSSKVSKSIDHLLTESSCITCHDELNGDLVAMFRDDIHSKRKISCQGCHGGNPMLPGEEAMSPKEGFIGVPEKPGEIPGFCARCHSDSDYMGKFNPGIPTDQAAKFSLSAHGKTLRKNPYDDKVANCLKCHGVHNIRAVEDPLSPVFATRVPETCNQCHGRPELMNEYGIFVDPYEDYRNSVHGQALLEQGELSAPACNDCHGNHGALPPEIESISHVCGQCHALNATLFSESVHRGIWEFRNMPACESCHGNHAIHSPTDEMLSTKPGSFCSNCHEANGPPDQVRFMLDSLEQGIGMTHELLQRAESYLVSVDEGFIKLDKARTNLTKMRVLLHRFDLDTLRATSQSTQKLINEVHEIGLAGIENARNRRRGFWVSFVVFLAFNALIILKIRELNARRRKESQR